MEGETERGREREGERARVCERGGTVARSPCTSRTPRACPAGGTRSAASAGSARAPAVVVC